MKTFIKKWIIVSLFIAGTGFSQVPPTISYQGYLTVPAGQPVGNGSYSIEFSIYNDSTAGTALWSETQEINVTDGIFHAQLGAVDSLDLPFNETYYLEMAINGGQPLTPRVEFTSSAYSLNASRVQGENNIFPSDGHVGIGTTNPSHELTVHGDLRVTNQHRLLFGADISGEYIYNADGQTLRIHVGNEDRMHFANNGDVGIGTVTPSEKLHVDGTIYSSSGGFRFPDGTVQTTAADTSNGTGYNTLDQAYDQGGPGAGRGITADAGAFEVNGTDGALFTGALYGGNIPAEGSGVKMMWYPNKAAFRAGSVDGSGSVFWNADSIGFYSIASGYNTRASASSSVAMGSNSNASGVSSIAMGDDTEASGVSSIAMGYNTRATGIYSTALGEKTNASGESSIAMGRETFASGEFSTAMGLGTTASSRTSTAMGDRTMAINESSTAMGYNTTASGVYSTAMGRETVASGPSSFAMGYATTAEGSYSTAIGYHTRARGYNSMTIGQGIEVSGKHSVAIALSDQSGQIVSQDSTLAVMGGKVGIGTIEPSANFEVNGIDGVLFEGTINKGSIPVEGEGVRMMWYPREAAFRVGELDFFGRKYWDVDSIGRYSFASGHNTRATGRISTAMGYKTIAEGNSSTAMGSRTSALGKSSIAMGYETTASGDYSTAIGKGVSTSGSGSFMIGDASASAVLSGTYANRFSARFADGYYFYSNSTSSVGAYLGSGSNSWGVISDSSKKENFKAIDGEAVLNKISQFKLSSWNYKGQDKTQFRHYGPMAQDFYNAFGHDGIGTIGNDTTIASADFDGINFIAIQALGKRTSQNEKRIGKSEQRSALSERRINSAENRIVKNEERIVKSDEQWAASNEQIAKSQKQIAALQNEIDLLKGQLEALLQHYQNDAVPASFSSNSQRSESNDQEGASDEIY